MNQEDNDGPSNQPPQVDIAAATTHKSGAINWEWWFAAALVFTGVVQAVISSCQWNSMSTQLELMRIDQRSWVTVESVEMDELIADSPHEFRVKVENVGKTPATVVSGEDGACLSKKDRVAGAIDSPPVGTSPNVWRNQQTIVPPGGSITLRSHARAISPEELSSIQNGTSVFVVLGSFKYVDVSSVTHQTRYSFFYDPKLKRFFINRTDNVME